MNNHSSPTAKQGMIFLFLIYLINSKQNMIHKIQGIEFPCHLLRIITLFFMEKDLQITTILLV